MFVSEALRKMMTRHKMRQSDVADAAGFKNQSNVGMILKSGSTMKLENLLRLADAMNCDIVIKDRETGEELVID